MSWDMDRLRKIAGLNESVSTKKSAVLNESADDDEDPDAKIAASDKRQQEFEKKNKSELKKGDVTADAKEQEREAARKAKATEKNESKPANNKEKSDKEVGEKASKALPAPAEKAEEAAKKRGRAANPDSKAGRAHSWIKSNPGKRGEFLAKAGEFGMSPAYAKTFWQSAKKRIANECYVLLHPATKSYILSENREMNQIVWADAASTFEPLVYATLEEAERMAKHMSEWKGQYCNIEKIEL